MALFLNHPIVRADIAILRTCPPAQGDRASM
jgi:hypothetical protein